LIDIKNSTLNTTLIFNKPLNQELIQILEEIPGFESITLNSVTYDYNIGIVENLDVGAVIKAVNKCLQTENTNIRPVNETYEILMTNILSVGEIYSTFIELILSILYVDNNNTIIRYQISKNKKIEIKKKYSIKEIHRILSPVLSLLYVPNTHSIKKYYESVLDQQTYIVSIYEKIWIDII
jgi:hypothetical protein